MTITEGTQPPPKTWTGAWSTAQTTDSFTPESGALLVALVSGDGVGSGNVTGQVSDSVDGTTGWVLLRRQNTQNGTVGATAEVWVKNSPAQAMTVSVTGSGALANGGQLVVRTLIGAQVAANQNGAVNGASLFTAAAVQISVAAGTGNRVYGAAVNYDTSAAMSPLANTSVINAFQDTTNGDCWEAFKSSADTAGTATYGYSTSHTGQIAAAEIKAVALTQVTATRTTTWNVAAGADSGPNYAGSAADLGGGSGTWTNPSNATGAANAAYATWTSP